MRQFFRREMMHTTKSILFCCHLNMHLCRKIITAFSNPNTPTAQCYTHIHVRKRLRSPNATTLISIDFGIVYINRELCVQEDESILVYLFHTSRLVSIAFTAIHSVHRNETEAARSLARSN